MLRRIDGSKAGVSFSYEGREIIAFDGDTLASALLAAGEDVFRMSPISGKERGPFCMMGVCFECLVEIDGAPNQQACMVVVCEGLTVRRQSIAGDGELS